MNSTPIRTIHTAIARRMKWATTTSVPAMGCCILLCEYGCSRSLLEKRPLRPDFTTRYLVDFALVGLSRTGHVSRIRQLGRLAECALHLRPLHLPVLFPGGLRRLSARLVRPQSFLVPELPAVFSGAAHSLVI